MFDRFILKALLVLCLGVSLTGCEAPASLTLITVTPGTASFEGPGLQTQLTATGTYSHGNHPAVTQNITDEVTWTSSTPACVTVSTTGLITSGNNTCSNILITASAPGFTGTITGSMTVNVAATAASSTADITSITVIPGTQSVAGVGQPAQFTAIGVTAAGTTTDLTTLVAWSSSSQQIATIGPKTGLASSVGQGTATITAVYTNPDKTVATGTAQLTVTAGTSASSDYTSLTVIPGTQSVAGAGQPVQYIAIGTTATGTTMDLSNAVAWSSSSTQVATICTAKITTVACPGTNNGQATTAGQGTTTVTAEYINKDNNVATGTAQLTVTAAAAASSGITSLTIIPSTQSVTMPLIASSTPTTFFKAIGTNGSTGLQQDETNSAAWYSSNSAVATINSTTGAVTPVGVGSTTITAIFNNTAASGATATGLTATATLTVTGVASEPLISLTTLPASQSISYPGQTSQLTAIGTFSSAPVTQNLNSNSTYPVTWTSSDTSVATVCTPATTSNPTGTCPLTPGLVTAVGQGTAAITAITANTDGSVVTGVTTITVVNGTTEQISALTIIPSSMSLSATGQPGQFVALGTSGTTGLVEDVTDSPQLTWSSSIPTIATIETYSATSTTIPGQAQGVSPGTTNITALYTNTAATGSTPAVVVTATGTVTVTSTPAAEPLLSIAVVPSTITDLNLLGTAQFLAYGTFSTAPTELEITNGFSHVGFPTTCTTAPCPWQPVTWVSTDPYNFPVDTAGAAGATGGLSTAYGSGNTNIYVVATNPDNTLVYSPLATFNCPYAAPTFGTTTTVTDGVSVTTTDYSEILNPGTCNSLTIADSLLSTLTVFNTGLNTTDWLITAPSATGTPDVIHCGGSTYQASSGGSVCEAAYPNGTTVILTAPAESGVNFGGWSSSCTPCTLSGSTCTAITSPPLYTATGPNYCSVVVGATSSNCSSDGNTGTDTCGGSNVSVGAIFN